MELSADKLRLRVSIAADLTAAEVETLISDLAERRANMQPPVPIERPTGGEQRVSVQNDPSLIAKPLRDGRIRIWLRNQGLGWLVFNFGLHQAISLRDLLIASTPDAQTGPRLFEDEGGSAH